MAIRATRAGRAIVGATVIALASCGSPSPATPPPASDAGVGRGEPSAEAGANRSSDDWWLDLGNGSIGAPLPTTPGAIADGSGHGLAGTAGPGLVFASGHPAGVVGARFAGDGNGIVVASPDVGRVADALAGEAISIEVGFRTEVHGREGVAGGGTLFERPGGFALRVVDGHLVAALGTAVLELAPLVSDGRWHRAIVTREPRAGVVRLSLDGASSVEVKHAAASAAIAGEPTLYVGTTADRSHGFAGAVDHVAIRHRSTAAFAGYPGDVHATVFQSGAESVPEGGTYAYVRIPSMVRTDAGTLVVAAEGRVSDQDDFGNIDVVVKRSVDGGRTWSKAARVANAGTNKVGNPILFFDHDAKRLVLLSLVTKLANGTPDGTTVQVQRSDDEGTSWSAPVDITASVTRPEWSDGVLVGPSHGIQLRQGKNAGVLVVHGMHRRATDGARGGHLWTSRDHGTTWSVADSENESAPDVNVNEGSLAELSDGRLYVNVRSSVTDVEAERPKGLRGEAIVDGNLAFVGKPAFKRTKRFRGPVVEGSTLRWPGSERYGDAPRILFAYPAGEWGTNFSQRHDLRLWTSDDDTRTFAPPFRVYGGKAAYSDLVAMDDSTLGVLYETALDSEGFDTRIELRTMPLQRLDDPTVLSFTFEDAKVGSALAAATSRGSAPIKLAAEGSISGVEGRFHSTAARFAPGARLCAANDAHAADVGIHDGLAVEVSFRTSAHGAGGAVDAGTLIAKSAIGTLSAWWLRVEDGHVRFAVSDESGALDIVESKESVSDGAYHTVVASRDVPGGRLTVSVDGHVASTTPITTKGYATNDDALCVGAFAGAAVTRGFVGDLDAVAVRVY